MKSLDQTITINELNFKNLDDCAAGMPSRHITALYDIAYNAIGQKRLVERAKRLEAEFLIESEKIEDRILALHRIVFDSKEFPYELDNLDYIDTALKSIEKKLCDILAKRVLENRIEKQVMEKLEEKQNQYMDEIKLQIINQKSGPENAYTLKKYALLERLETIKLAKTPMELFRPKNLDEIVGQDLPIKALVSKLASPFPQHIIIYGPPGVGKTTAARLALEYAKGMKYTPFDGQAKFIEVDGTTLRWDPREITNPLLGSVHDPIYQGSKKDLAEVGIPEPKPGLVTEAHGGVLFIDEIGELDSHLQNKLLKVLEDKRVFFDSAYFDPDNPAVPLYVKKLFENGAPADFILIGATTRQPHEINPALRSRCGEVFFEPLSPVDIQQIVKDAASRLSILLEDGVEEIISHHTIEGRKAVRILSDAYGYHLHKNNNENTGKITKEDIYHVIKMGRIAPNVRKCSSDIPEIGRIFGLGVNGFIGSTIELESIVFKAAEGGKGILRFNDTAGSMARDSIFNAASVIRKLTGHVLSDYDVHVNAVGGGNIDGPSAGAAIVIAIISSLENRRIRQDMAVTGEISLRGKIKPVGGISEKIYGARQAGMKKVLIPKDNLRDIHGNFDDIEIIPIDTIEEAINKMLIS